MEVDLVPPNREITIRDLLTHGSGLLSGGLGNRQAGALATRGEGDTLATYIPKLGAVPLDFQPGALRRYRGPAGFDVLSRIVEIASGQSYDRFLRQRLFDPLGMKDSGSPGHRIARRASSRCISARRTACSEWRTRTA